MKRVSSGLVLILFMMLSASAQETCETTAYLESAIKNNFLSSGQVEWLENFIATKKKEMPLNRGGDKSVITIPVVFHVLYHTSIQNIPDAQIHSQVTVLNESFRRLAADTVNTPERFRNLAADCYIEFKLATSDARRRYTDGIVRKYTPISIWDADDKMKFSSEMGADAWDSKQFLNIWVCPLRRSLGYASFPGGDPLKDGIVLNSGTVGVTRNVSFGEGKVAVHEAGHWLGLRHIWGDDYCGDDGVDDTPKQAGFTNGCPTGVRLSCGSGAAGDMYMNYMDLTNDACINLFTNGQSERMRLMFEVGGPRESFHTSIGLQPPLIHEIPVAEEPPRWLRPNLFPNPAGTEITIDLAYDPRWVGNVIYLTNIQGVRVMMLNITSPILNVDISHLKPGIYLLTSLRKDGEKWQEKVVKM